MRAVVEKLAPTGEGVVRTREGVGLVTGALPGEDIEAEVLRVSRKIWRGRVSEIHAASPYRRSGGHAGGCPACDWAHIDLSAARDAKRDLFLETMSRIGKLAAGDFGALSVEPSPAGYRLRSRFHAERRGGGEVAVGGFAPRTHRVESLAECLALGEQAREFLPRLERALSGSGVDVPEIATVESLDGKRRLVLATLSAARPSASASASASASPRGEPPARAKRLSAALAPLCDGGVVRDGAGRVLSSWGAPRLWISPAGRELPATADAFFQANRFLVGTLAGYVREAAAAVPVSDALDLFGGVGLFAGSLLDAGHSVVSVESDREAAAGARLARDRWNARERWRIERGDAVGFAAADPGREAVVVADPPRGGLGLPLARALAGRAGRRIIYVSCDPATLARDLAAITAEGWEISGARLFDLFALTHRVESVVVLDRARQR